MPGLLQSLSNDFNFVVLILIISQVEYAYPPFIEDYGSDSNECPPGWKYLPTLALPDGSHNYTHDTVYFHLPSLNDRNQTVFGISCYRQIPVEVIIGTYNILSSYIECLHFIV